MPITITATKSRRNLARIANCTLEEMQRCRHKSIPQHIPTQRFCEVVMSAAAAIMLRMSDGDPTRVVQVRYRAGDKNQFRPAVKRIQNLFNADRISREQAEAVAKTLLGILATETPGQLEATKHELTSAAAS